MQFQLQDCSMNSFTLASKLGWDTDDEENEIIEIRPSHARINVEVDSWELPFKYNEFFDLQLKNCSESELLFENVIDIDEDIELSPSSATVVEIPECMPLESFVKPGRFYSRKNKRIKIESPTPNTSAECDKNSDENVICVISEVIGNAGDLFDSEDSIDACEASDNFLVVPKKTNDITKIKGWRKKQFFVEKQTSEDICNSLEETKNTVDSPKLEESKMNNENIFVCDSLDDFLNKEAKLNVSYEIPHLYAEIGIKLTSDIVASKPNFSHEEHKKDETKCNKSLPNTNVNDELNSTNEASKNLKTEIEKNVGMSRALRIKNCRKKTYKTIIKKPASAIPEVKTKEVEVYFEQTPYKMNLELLKNLNLESKLVGLAVHPEIGKPLHPVIQAHLRKLRNSNIEIDYNWANFASSAVKVENQSLTKMILPVYICGKAVEAEKVNFGTQTNDEPVTLQENLNEQTLTEKPIAKLKNCIVILEKLKFPNINIWCMEHNCYNCKLCGYAKNKKTSEPKELKKPIDMQLSDQVPSYRSKDQREILMNKIREIKFGAKPKGIQYLKKYPSKGIELIKLNFIKESFLTGDVNIWYMKPNEEVSSSRAFLTFSETSPFPNAINLKSKDLSLCNLPQVITGFLIKGKLFSLNEYALLYFDGNAWEIQGVLNVDVGYVGKSNNIKTNVSHIFTPSTLPELTQLQRISSKILEIMSCKWWVIDLSQNVDEIAVQSGNFSTAFNLKKLRNFVKGHFGYIRFKDSSKWRLLGIYVIQKLLPFGLIGPFKDAEDVKLIALNNFIPDSFEYSCNKEFEEVNCLKYYINSLLTEYEDTSRKVFGLWFYDRIFFDNTCFLEVFFIYKYVYKAKICNMANINIEHNYSLNSITTPLLGGIERRPSENLISQRQIATIKIKVYIYFEIFDLGYIEGELQADNSVVIEHPFNKKTKIISAEIGEQFIKTIKCKIQFIPNDIKIRWFITKHKEDVMDREPFDKYYLSGAHFLCKKGIFYLLTLTDSKIKELELEEQQIFNAILESNSFIEVKRLKQLSEILAEECSGSMTAIEVVEKAVEEIKRLEENSKAIAKEIDEIMGKRLDLGCIFLKNLNEVKGSDKIKTKIVTHTYHLFEPETNKTNHEHFIKKLEEYSFGRKFLQSLKI